MFLTILGWAIAALATIAVAAVLLTEWRLKRRRAAMRQALIKELEKPPIAKAG